MENRVIKFRALKDDVSNCNWVHGCLVYDAIGTPRITEVDSSGHGLLFHTCLKGTESQFTGLHDKNGKEVFESDIVLFYGEKILVKYGIMLVDAFECIVFNLYDFYGESEDIGKAKRLQESIEVIGNIFENESLLQ